MSEIDVEKTGLNEVKNIFQSPFGKDTQEITKILLENQKKLSEQATSPADIAKFERISIPLIRRIYPSFIGPMFSGIATVDSKIEELVPSKKKKKQWRDINEPWEPSKNAETNI